MAYFLVFCKQYLHRPALPTTRRMAMLWEKLRDVVLFPEAKLCTSPRIAGAHSASLCLISRHPNLKVQLAMLLPDQCNLPVGCWGFWCLIWRSPSNPYSLQLLYDSRNQKVPGSKMNPDNTRDEPIGSRFISSAAQEGFGSYTVH